ncbi:hypothetical protein [Microbacterium sp. H1-D42]|uniref:hypothetical protein n=1 Tax=Microbacterium sp. H1-D42 TaxID=2925844 RepID=UPI001F537D2A|nr:hypothetical protein [Microbacterium sp. H1-D42]UNK70311.1 hypothetical protein MNR00_14250 [Microbacterium sp. H1-D42]
MTFFPPGPEIPELEEEEAEPSQPRWWQAPEDELPELLPVSEVLAVTDHVAVALIGIAVHSDGVQLQVERRLRRNGLPLRDWNELCNAFTEHMSFGGPIDATGRLRFGVVLADGTKVTDASPFFACGDPMVEPEGHTLSRRQLGGGGGGSTYSSADHLWLWPLPPAGPIELVMQWPALGIQETRLVVDASLVPELAARAQSFWPR